MKIAVLIISLCLSLLIGLQSCAVTVGGSLSSDEVTTQGGAVGIFVAFLYIIGAAFALKLPKVSMIVFSVAAFFGLVAAVSADFDDMQIWGIVSLVLTAMSYFGSREKQEGIVK